jgi:hypothetical protein
MRPTVSWISLTISLLAGLSSFVMVSEFAIQSRAVPGVLAILSGSALIVALATVKKVEYARFCGTGYGSVLLNIARSGPERNKFDGYVQAVVTQIEYANKLNQGAQPPPA